VTRLSTPVPAALSLLVAFALVSCSCANPALAGGDGISILSYNVQTLFDDELQGSEFPEFRPEPGGWNTVAYQGRLRNLARVIRECRIGGPDLIAFQEVENASVLDDLVRFFLRDMGYRYRAFVSLPGNAFGQGVISRLPLSRVRSIGAGDGSARLRPALELRVGLTRESGSDELLLYVVHWKSKRDAEEEGGELLRRLQAHSLALRLSELCRDEPDIPAVIVGDFNESPGDFAGADGFRTALVPAGALDDWSAISDSRPLMPLVLGRPACELPPMSPGPVLRQFWDLEPAGAGGSYVYSGGWERIDNMLLTGPMLRTFAGFEARVVSPSFLLDSDGEPRGYRRGSAYGFSDHLPLLLEIRY
jgi:endonuclease/exonuclease/phosphatase family metal-dependent hydrolase